MRDTCDAVVDAAKWWRLVSVAVDLETRKPEMPRVSAAAHILEERPMNDREAIEMMQRCKHEIESQRREIDRLRPKAEAYESVAQVLALMPQRSQGVGEDLAWTLGKRIRDLEQVVNAATVADNPST